MQSSWRTQPLPKIGPWRDKLDQLLLANEGKAARERLTLIRLFEELHGLGYDGGYDAVRRYARQWSKEREPRRRRGGGDLQGSCGGHRTAALHLRRARRRRWRGRDVELGYMPRLSRQSSLRLGAG